MIKRLHLHSRHPLRFHLWLAYWPEWVGWAERHRCWLSEAERRRIDAFRKPEPARRLLVHRCIARRLLAKVLGIPPEDVPLQTEARGKPFLAGRPDMAISFSHTGPWLAIGMTPEGGQLGIDIERILPDFDYRAVAEAYFHPDVQARIRTVEEFFRAWTLREAVAKALGTGITDELLAKKEEELVPSTAIVHYQKVESCLICMVWWGEGEKREE